MKIYIGICINSGKERYLTQPPQTQTNKSETIKTNTNHDGDERRRTTTMATVPAATGRLLAAPIIISIQQSPNK